MGVILLKVFGRNRVSNLGPTYLESSTLALSYSSHKAFQPVEIVVITVYHLQTDPTLAYGGRLPAISNSSLQQYPGNLH